MFYNFPSIVQEANEIFTKLMFKGILMNMWFGPIISNHQYQAHWGYFFPSNDVIGVMEWPSHFFLDLFSSHSKNRNPNLQTLEPGTGPYERTNLHVSLHGFFMFRYPGTEVRKCKVIGSVWYFTPIDFYL